MAQRDQLPNAHTRLTAAVEQATMAQRAWSVTWVAPLFEFLAGWGRSDGEHDNRPFRVS